MYVRILKSPFKNSVTVTPNIENYPPNSLKSPFKKSLPFRCHCHFILYSGLKHIYNIYFHLLFFPYQTDPVLLHFPLLAQSCTSCCPTLSSMGTPHMCRRCSAVCLKLPAGTMYSTSVIQYNMCMARCFITPQSTVMQTHLASDSDFPTSTQHLCFLHEFFFTRSSYLLTNCFLPYHLTLIISK